MRRFAASSCVLALMVLTNAAPSNFRLKNGDRVLFYGDSITEQHLYTNFVETFVVTRFPGLDVQFRNTGVGGDRVTGGWAGGIDIRLSRDFFAHKPTVATIMLGMNDASYRAFDQGVFDTYSNGYKKIVADIQKNLPGCKLFLIQPSPFDDVAHKPNWDPGYNSVLATYGEFVKGLAMKAGCEEINLNGPLVADLENAVKIDPTHAADLVKDRVHPGSQFQLLMAEQILKAWNAPAVVSDVAIDFGKRIVVKSESSKVTLKKDLEWTQLDACLPFPLEVKDDLVKLALKSSDFVEALDREMLTVTGLTASSYELSIDGKSVGVFSKSDLENGINLALLDTPMVQQAFQVQNLTNRHNWIFMTRWRNLQIDFGDEPNVSKAVKAIDSLEQDAVKRQRAMAKPVVHSYRLVAR